MDLWIIEVTVIDKTGLTEKVGVGTIYYGPWNVKSNAEEWAEMFLPGVELRLLCMNLPFNTKQEMEEILPLLVKKETE